MEIILSRIYRFYCLISDIPNYYNSNLKAYEGIIQISRSESSRLTKIDDEPYAYI